MPREICRTGTRGLDQLAQPIAREERHHDQKLEQVAGPHDLGGRVIVAHELRDRVGEGEQEDGDEQKQDAAPGRRDGRGGRAHGAAPPRAGAPLAGRDVETRARDHQRADHGPTVREFAEADQTDDGARDQLDIGEGGQQRGRRQLQRFDNGEVDETRRAPHQDQHQPRERRRRGPEEGHQKRAYQRAHGRGVEQRGAHIVARAQAAYGDLVEGEEGGGEEREESGPVDHAEAGPDDDHRTREADGDGGPAVDADPLGEEDDRQRGHHQRRDQGEREHARERQERESDIKRVMGQPGHGGGGELEPEAARAQARQGTRRQHHGRDHEGLEEHPAPHDLDHVIVVDNQLGETVGGRDQEEPAGHQENAEDGRPAVGGGVRHGRACGLLSRAMRAGTPGTGRCWRDRRGPSMPPLSGRPHAAYARRMMAGTLWPA